MESTRSPPDLLTSFILYPDVSRPNPYIDILRQIVNNMMWTTSEFMQIGIHESSDGINAVHLKNLLRTVNCPNPDSIIDVIHCVTLTSFDVRQGFLCREHFPIGCYVVSPKPNTLDNYSPLESLNKEVWLKEKYGVEKKDLMYVALLNIELFRHRLSKLANDKLAVAAIKEIGVSTYTDKTQVHIEDIVPNSIYQTKKVESEVESDEEEGSEGGSTASERRSEISEED